MSDSAGGAVATVAVMGGVYIFVDSIALVVLGGVLLGLFLIAATICGIVAAAIFVQENPIKKMWGWLVYFVFAPILIAAPFAYVYYGPMNQQTTISSANLSGGENLAMFLSFFWLVFDVLAAGALYIFLASLTEDMSTKQKA